MMNITDGHRLRIERQRLRLSLAALAELADHPGTSCPRISNFECGGRMGEDAIRRISYVLEGIDRIQSSFPFAIDMKNVASLKLAFAAYERGDSQWFAARNVVPKLPDQPVITY